MDSDATLEFENKGELIYFQRFPSHIIAATWKEGFLTVTTIIPGGDHEEERVPLSSREDAALFMIGQLAVAYAENVVMQPAPPDVRGTGILQ